MKFVMQKNICRLFCGLVVLGVVETLSAQGTAFMYQGRLNDGGNPATGNYDLRLQIYDAVTNGNAINLPLTNAAVAVNNGLFTTTLDFGPGIFTGTNYWLDIGVRTNGNPGTFTLLSPRQPVLPVPYAIFANSASNLLGTLAATQLSGTLPASAFTGYTNTVSFTNGANLFSGTFNGAFGGTFNGNGAALTNLNASQLASGTVADARLSTNVALLNGNQIFTGANIFTNMAGNSFSGSFFGNGLVGWIPTNGTAFQAQIDHGYLLTNSQLVTVTLPASPNPGDIVRISGAGSGGWKIAQNTNQSVIGSFSGYANSFWTAESSANVWESIASSSDGTKLVAAAGNAGIFNSADGGMTWTKGTGSPAGADAVASSADGTKCVAAFNNGGLGGGIFTTTNSGSTWITQNNPPTSADWFSVASSADGTKLVAVINNNGRIYVSSDSGVTWTAQTVSPNNNANWYAVASSANGSKLVAVVKGGGIYTNSGTWKATSASSLNWVAVTSSADGSKLAAVVLGGGIYTSGNSGSTWAEQTNAPTSVNWLSIASSADGSKLAASVFGGGIYFSANFGVTWALQTNAPANANWQGIALSADGSQLAATINNNAPLAPPVGIYLSHATVQTSSMTGTNGYIIGAQGSAVELQYIGNGQFMPVSSAGTIWAN